MNIKISLMSANIFLFDVGIIYGNSAGECISKHVELVDFIWDWIKFNGRIM